VEANTAVVFKMPESEVKLPSHAIVSRQVDFWLLGGASLFFLVLVIIGNLFINRSMRVSGYMLSISRLFATLALFVNYPHFLISYKFGYGRGRAFIISHWFALIFVPLALIAAFVFAYFSLGGITILSWSVVVMGTSVGWHYLKQIFGCMMVYSRYDNYSIDQKQRRILLWHFYILGGLNLFYTAATNSKFLAFDIPRVPIHFPSWFTSAFYILTAISLGVAAYSICYKNYKEKRILPSLNFLIPWIAFLTWFVPFFGSMSYFWIAIPFFHSLQYLPFAYRLETSKSAPTSQRQERIRFSMGFLKVIGICALGFLFFEGLPEIADGALNTQSHFNLLFFFAVANIFINIHHYFIDSVVWKFSDPVVRESLF
jgi:hypothetical protein